MLRLPSKHVHGRIVGRNAAEMRKLLDKVLPEGMSRYLQIVIDGALRNSKIAVHDPDGETPGEFLDNDVRDELMFLAEVSSIYRGIYDQQLEELNVLVSAASGRAVPALNLPSVTIQTRLETRRYRVDAQGKTGLNGRKQFKCRELTVDLSPPTTIRAAWRFKATLALEKPRNNIFYMTRLIRTENELEEAMEKAERLTEKCVHNALKDVARKPPQRKRRAALSKSNRCAEST
jgi:hypothetical protein